MNDEIDTLDDVVRNDPTQTFDAHLFARAEVDDAGADMGEQTDRAVASLCSRTTAYGEFYDVPHEADVDEPLPDALGLCDLCAGTLVDLQNAEIVQNADYADLQKVASTTESVPGSGLDGGELAEQLVEELGEDEVASRLHDVREQERREDGGSA